MKIIKIEPYDNGGHDNLTSDYLTTVPEGYAEIPDGMPIPDTFPFVNIEVAEETRYNDVTRYDAETNEPVVEKVPYTVKVVTRMTAGVKPEPEPELGREPSTDDVLNILLGVN